MSGGYFQFLIMGRLALPVVVEVAGTGKGDVEGAAGELIVVQGLFQQPVKLGADGLRCFVALPVESCQLAVVYPG